MDLDLPRQTNGFDCGMFVILNADAISNNQPLVKETFCESDIPLARLQLVKVIKNPSLILKGKS
jgi:Ulp1 family protease